MGALRPDPGERLQHLVVAGQLAAELLNRARGDGMDLVGLPLVEGRRPDERVDLVRGKRDDVLRRGSGFEEADADRQTLLVAGADGDDAGHELLKRRVEAPLGQLEHRRLGVRLHRLRDALHGDVDVERLLALCDSPRASPTRGGRFAQGEGVASLRGKTRTTPSCFVPPPLRPLAAAPQRSAPLH